MPVLTSAGPAASSAAARRSTRLAFLIAGFAGAAWAPLIPFVKAHLALGDGALGLLLLCFGLGSIGGMPVAALLTGRFGCRPVVTVGGMLAAGAFPVLATSGSVPLLVVALLVFGAGIGTVDCIINVQAVIVEKESYRPMMSGFHGLFSVGGILGAGGTSLLLAAGATPAWVSVTVCVLILLACVAAWPGLLSGGMAPAGSTFAVPRGPVLLIGVLCFVVFLTEGAAIDWSAVFLSAVRGMELDRAGLGYIAFAATMTAGRLGGNGLVQRLGGRALLVGGAGLAALGMGAIAVVPYWPAAVLGYAVVGAGCSNIVPVLTTALGRQRYMPEHLAVPAATTMGYSGILLGPALLGLIANATSLPIAIATVAVALVGVAAFGIRVQTA